MTIRVYLVDTGTGTREPVGELVRALPGDPERPRPNLLLWPPCKCPRCKASAE